MLNKKKVLGRGLGALMGGGQGSAAAIADIDKTDTDEKYLSCPVSLISPNKTQPRKNFSAASLKELADSIRSNGVIEPIVARRVADGFEIIAGERRWRASKMAGLERVPVVVMQASDEQSLELAIIENIQREDLNAIEEADAYKSLMSFGLSQAEVAEKVGKDRVTVANYLRLLKLPPEVKDEIVKGTILMGHARALLALEGHAARTNLCRTIIRKGLSVREAEALAAKKTRGTGGANADSRGRKSPSPMENELIEILGTKVSLKERMGKGSIVIHYYSAEERERLFDLLRTIDAK